MNVKKKDLKEIHKAGKQKLARIAEYYGLPSDQIEDRIWKKLDLVLAATSLDEAATLAKKAEDSMALCCLVLWGKKKIPGPATPENFEKKASVAEKLADFQAHLGNMEASKKQRDKAIEFRKKAMELREAHA